MMKKKIVLSLMLVVLAAVFVLVVISIAFPITSGSYPENTDAFVTDVAIALTPQLTSSTNHDDGSGLTPTKTSPVPQSPMASGVVKTRDLMNVVATRRPTMENDLSLGFEIIEVQIAAEPTTHVRLYYMVTFENISEEPLFVKENIFGMQPADDSTLQIENEENERINFQVYPIPDYTKGEAILSQEDFLELDPDQKISIECETPISMVVDEARDTKESLAPGTYTVYLVYFNHLVGYPVVVPEEEREYPGDWIALVDLNAWVGKVSSNQVTFVMPDLSDYPLPEYSVSNSKCKY